MATSMKAVSLTREAREFSEHWSPKCRGFNGHDVMVVKVKGEFVWHSHETRRSVSRPQGPLRIDLPTAPSNWRGRLSCAEGIEHRGRDEEAHLLRSSRPAPQHGDPATAAIKQKI